MLEHQYRTEFHTMLRSKDVAFSRTDIRNQDTFQILLTAGGRSTMLQGCYYKLSSLETVATNTVFRLSAAGNSRIRQLNSSSR